MFRAPHRRAPHPRARPRRTPPRWLTGLVTSVVLFAGCTDDQPEESTAEILSQLEGRELTAAELAQREEIAQTLCRLDDAILVEIWGKLSAKQLEFQDFVFSRACDSRSQLYAESTGRFAVTGN